LAGDGASLKYATVRTKRPKSHGRSRSAAQQPNVERCSQVRIHQVICR
jgi:hypothetical protein